MMKIKGVIDRAKSNRLLVEGTIYSIFSFINQGISFVLLILLANYILPEEYGRLSIFNTIVTFMGYIVALSTSGYESVSFFKKDFEEYRKDFSVVTYITVIGTFLLLVLILPVNRWLSSLSDLPLRYFIYAISISSGTVFINRLLDFYRINQNLKKYGLYSCGFALFNFGLSLYLVASLELGWNGRVYAQLGCVAAFTVIAFFVFIRRNLITFNVSITHYKDAILWGLPLIPHMAATWLRQGCDRFIVNSHFGLQEVGLFSFALNLMSVIVIFGVAFNSSNSVSIYQILSSAGSAEEKKQKFAKQKNATLIIYSIGTVAITVIGVVLMPMVLPNYTGAVPYFAILSVAGFFQCLYFLYCNLIFYFEKNKYIMFITFFSSLFHLMVSLIITRYSLYYTAILHVFTQAIIYLLVKKVGMKILNESL